MPNTYATYLYNGTKIMSFVIEAKNTSGMNSPFVYEAVVNKNILYCNSQS